MLKKEDVNTLDRARAFLLMFAHDVAKDDGPLIHLCRPHVPAPVFAAYPLMEGIVSPGLHADYLARFLHAPADLEYTGTDVSGEREQLAMLLRSLPAGSAHAYEDQCAALLYAPLLLHDEAYRDDVWRAYMETTDRGRDVRSLDGYMAGLWPTALPLA